MHLVNLILGQQQQRRATLATLPHVAKGDARCYGHSHLQHELALAGAARSDDHADDPQGQHAAQEPAANRRARAQQKIDVGVGDVKQRGQRPLVAFGVVACIGLRKARHRAAHLVHIKRRILAGVPVQGHLVHQINRKALGKQISNNLRQCIGTLAIGVRIQKRIALVHGRLRRARTVAGRQATVRDYQAQLCFQVAR